MVTQLVKTMDPEGPLSCSQEPVTGPYPDANEYGTQRHALFFSMISLILSSHYL